MISARIVCVLLAAAAILLAAALVMTRRALAGRKEARDERAFAIAELELRLCELQQRSREASLLAEMSEHLHASTSLAEAMHFLPSFGRRLFPLFDGAVYIAEGSGATFALATFWGDAPRSSAFPVEACRALRRAEPHAARDAACRHDPPTARLCMPISVGESIGVLALRSASRRDLTAGVEAVARTFADQVSLAR